MHALLLAVTLGPTIAAAADAASSHQERAFEAAQWAQLSSAGKALQQLGLRAAAGSPELAGLVRKRQDLVAMVSQRERALADAGETDAKSEASRLIGLRGEIDSLQTESPTSTATSPNRFRATPSSPIPGR